MSIHTRHLLIAITMTLSACSQSDRRGEGKTFVLVHGAWMGAAGWEPVADRLRAEGAEVIVPELPAHGEDPAPPGDATLAGYVERVTAALDSAGAPIILVGHSMGGMVVSATAEERAPDIARLVYLAAYVPEDGQSLFDLAMSDEDSEVGESLVDNHDGTVGIRPEAFADLFCADCDPFTRDDLIAGYRDEPVAPLATPVSLTDAGFGSVPRTYIGTARDRVISPALQAHMIDATPMDRAVTLDTSHVPMLAAPGAVVDALLAE
jgi:pimeloyl-ACP methyl ester carboxylesterase